MARVSHRKKLLIKKKLCMLLLLRNRNKYKKRMWVRQLFQERKRKGEFNLLVHDMKLFDSEWFFRYFRMSPKTFEVLLSWVAPHISKKGTRMREPISAAERLSVALRYLVTGDAQITIATNYRMSPSVVGRIILETCNAIWLTLKEKGFIESPKTSADWELIAKEFYEKWQKVADKVMGVFIIIVILDLLLKMILSICLLKKISLTQIENYLMFLLAMMRLVINHI